MLDESSKDKLPSETNNNDIWNDMSIIHAGIWHWMHCDSALPCTNNRRKWQKWHVNYFYSYLALNALWLSFTIYKQQGNVTKVTCQLFLRLFDTECIVTQLYHIQTTGESDKSDMSIISIAIWHWMHCQSALPYTSNRGRWQNLKQKKHFCLEKKNFKKCSLLFFGVNVNFLKRTSLQALWNILQPSEHWRRVVLSSIDVKKWFLNLIRGMTVISSNNFIQWVII